MGIVADVGPGPFGGVRFQRQGSRFAMYGQVLIDTFLAVRPGMGVDVQLTSRTAVRTGADMTFYGEDGHSWMETRVSVGLVYRFFKR